MKQLKLKVQNQFGNPLTLNPEEITVTFPYLGERVLSKRMTTGGVRILNAGRGEIEVDLDDMEVQGLNEGEKQTFLAVIKQNGKLHQVAFTAGLSVVTIEGRKAIL